MSRPVDGTAQSWDIDSGEGISEEGSEYRRRGGGRKVERVKIAVTTVLPSEVRSGVLVQEKVALRSGNGSVVVCVQINGGFENNL